MERTPTFQIQPFGNYYLLERIAVGGMAEIFKAKQVGVRGFEKIVVIKKILHHLSEDPEFVEMFEDEARIAAQLTQANIVQIYELGEISGTLYITMEHVEGKNLRDITRAVSNRHLHLGLDQCIFIIMEVLKGLDFAHRKTDSRGQALEIVHRDMSPQNIIVSYEGEVKVLDFGIAKAASKISKTEAGVLKGKFSYMSPEQASGKILDQRSDIYAVGVIAHELLTSERLFRAKSDLETLDRVKAGQVLPPSLKNPQIAKELDTIILKALSKNLNERYQTAAEFLNDLSKFSFQSNLTYGSQDLGAFMKSLFSETIAEEKERLASALARVPQTQTDQILNAQTRVSFKSQISDISTSSATASPNEPLAPDATFTVSKRAKPRLISRKSFVLSSFLVLFAGLIFLFILSPTKEPSSNPTPISNANDTNSEIPLVKAEPEATPHQDTNPNIGKVEKLFGNVEPQADDILPVPTIPSPSPQTLERTIEEKFPEPKVIDNKRIPFAKNDSIPAQPQNGIINVLPPTDGFAQLSINGKNYGTVPGPKARGITLTTGKHSIICETKSYRYEGVFTVSGDSEQNINCSSFSKKKLK